jgi:hypothetical protein
LSALSQAARARSVLDVYAGRGALRRAGESATLGRWSIARKGRLPLRVRRLLCCHHRPLTLRAEPAADRAGFMSNLLVRPAYPWRRCPRWRSSPTPNRDSSSVLARTCCGSIAPVLLPRWGEPAGKSHAGADRERSCGRLRVMRSGFGGEASLRRAFVRHLGVSPTAYRRQCGTAASRDTATVR